MLSPEATVPRPFNGVDPACYAYLFGHQGVEIEQIGEHLDPAGFSLAALYRQTTSCGRNRRGEQERRDTIDEQVIQTLTSYDALAHGEGEPVGGAEARFGFFSTESRDLTAQLVSGVLTRWDRALQRQKNAEGGVLDTKFGPEPVILEAAIAVIRTCMRHHGGFSRRFGASRKRALMRKVAYYGPGYIDAWMDGTLIQSLAEAEGMDIQAQAEWLRVCTTSRRGEALETADPAYSISQARKRYEDLAPEKIQAVLGWSDKEVALIQPFVRKELAFRYRRGPYEEATTLRHLMDTVMTDERIAERLGWTVAQVKSRVSYSERLSAALGNPTDPLEACMKAVRRGNIRLQPGRVGRPPRQPAQQPVS